VDLTRALRRWALPRPLLVAVPGATAVRLAVEAEVRRRGWRPAWSPAEADLLVVCGSPGPAMSGVADRLAGQLPAPWLRVDVAVPNEVAGRLQRAAEELPSTRGSVSSRPAPAGSAEGAGRLDQADPVGPRTAHRGGGQGDHGGHGEHGGHGSHGGHGAGHDTDLLVAGLPMAERSDDRDGLRLDELHLPLGPVLPGWPAGLVVWAQLQGDVITTATVEELDGGEDGDGYWGQPWAAAAAGAPPTRGGAARRAAAGRLDALAALLTVAGWSAAGQRARRLRDELLAGASAAEVAASLAGFARRVRRSRTLRWATDGLGPLSGPDAADTTAAGVAADTTDAGGAPDATGRWRAWLAAAAADVARLDDERPLAPDDVPPRAEAAVGALPGLLAGEELARARLLVASVAWGFGAPASVESTTARVHSGH